MRIFLQLKGTLRPNLDSLHCIIYRNDVTLPCASVTSGCKVNTALERSETDIVFLYTIINTSIVYTMEDKWKG